MIKLRSLINNSKVQVIYLSKSEISRIIRSEIGNVTYITMKNGVFTSYDVLETPEEILAMPDIETTEKVIDWEQRRFEAAMHFAAHQWMFESPKPTAVQAVEFADALINELKKGQNND